MATEERKAINRRHFKQVVNWWLNNKAPDVIDKAEVKKKAKELNDKQVEDIMNTIYAKPKNPPSGKKIEIKGGYVDRVTNAFSGKLADKALNELISGMTGMKVKEDEPKEDKPKTEAEKLKEKVKEGLKKGKESVEKMKEASEETELDPEKEFEKEKLSDVGGGFKIDPEGADPEGEEVEVEVPVEPTGRGKKKATPAEIEEIAKQVWISNSMERIQQDYDLKKLSPEQIVKLEQTISESFRAIPTTWRNPTWPYTEMLERSLGVDDVEPYKYGGSAPEYKTTTTTPAPTTTTTTTTTTAPTTTTTTAPTTTTTTGEKKQEHRSPSFREGLKAEAEAKVETKPIELPVNYKFKDEELKERNEEGGWQMNRQNKGTQRPKFITPSVNVLQPSEQAKQAQYDEWAIFDFVKPEELGASGNLGNNPLKRMVDTEHETIMRNAGIDLDPALSSVFKDRMIDTNQEQLKADMLPPLMPDTSKEPRQVYDVSEYEVKSYDVTNDRTAIEMASPYDSMTPIVLTNDGVRKSVLYGRCP